jgi:hypothetical protein
MTTNATAPSVHGGHEARLGHSERSDRWWVGPLLTALGLGGFVVYTTWAALQGEHYWYGSYLSPFYSPVLFASPAGTLGAAPASHAWFGEWPSWWPSFLPASPAIWILVFPGAFRFTCYYYRKAYYRSFAASPPGCAVCPMRRRDYRGETRLLLFQNLHRYALYFALLFVVFLTYDALASLFRDVGGEVQLGVGVGSVVLLVNAALLAAYTLGCHSWRHLIGGRLNQFTRGGRPTLAYKVWQRVTWLNQRHMLFAWLSLFWVGFADFYIRMLSMGYIRDLSTWS